MTASAPRHSRWPKLLVAVTACTGVTALGCHGLERSQSCRALASATHPVLDSIERLSTSPEPSTEDWLAIGAQYDQLAQYLEGYESRDAKLTQLARAQSRTFQLAARATRRLGTVPKAAAGARIRRQSRKELEALALEQKRQVDRINRHCQP